jgi:hypothetical protein
MAKVTKGEVNKERHGPKSILDAFNDIGITPDYLAVKALEELEAENVVVVSTAKGLEKVSVPSWGTRQKARQDIHTLRKDYPATAVDLNIPNGLGASLYGALNHNGGPQAEDE